MVIDKRDHIGGNIYTEKINDINVHQYGPHIFHTDKKEIWDYVNSFTEFNRFTNSPIAYYRGKIYNMPFNMNTFYQIWGVITPDQAAKKIKEQQIILDRPIRNLEEQALHLVGSDIYQILIKGYTEKQWGRKANELPASIIRRLPLRYTYDNNYYNDKYQGIPINGYTAIIKSMLDDIEVKTNTDFLSNREYFMSLACKIIYTGMIDEFYNYQFGELEYRSLRFETQVLPIDNFQGNAVVNYNEYEVPYTRIIEHKHFEFGHQKGTVITYEYPDKWEKGKESYYPINDDVNTTLYERYKALAKNQDKVKFSGRLGNYKYYDMDDVIECALNDCEEELSRGQYVD